MAMEVAVVVTDVTVLSDHLESSPGQVSSASFLPPLFFLQALVINIVWITLITSFTYNLLGM